MTNDADAATIALFNQAWHTYDQLIQAEQTLLSIIVFSLGSLTSASTERMILLHDLSKTLRPFELVPIVITAYDGTLSPSFPTASPITVTVQGESLEP